MHYNKCKPLQVISLLVIENNYLIFFYIPQNSMAACHKHNKPRQKQDDWLSYLQIIFDSEPFCTILDDHNGKPDV